MQELPRPADILLALKKEKKKVLAKGVHFFHAFSKGLSVYLPAPNILTDRHCFAHTMEEKVICLFYLNI
jgi:hypothetical protein